MPGSRPILLAVLLVVLATAAMGVTPASARSVAGRAVGISAAGAVHDPHSGERRSGARLAGVHEPDARVALLGPVGDVVKIGAKAVCGAICLGVDLTKKVAGGAKRLAGDLAQGALGDLAKGVAAGGAWMMRRTAGMLQRTTTPVLTAAWFKRRYEQMRHVAVLFAALALFAGVIGAIVAADGRAMVRTVAVRLPLAFALSGGLCVLTEMAVEVADRIAGSFASSFETDMSTVLGHGAKALVKLTVATGQPVVPAIITIVVALFAILTAFALWLEFVVRDAGIYTMVFLAPLVLGAMVWERCVPLLTRTLAVLVALILSKPLIVSLMSLAGGGLASGVGEQGIDVVLPVLVLMLLACLTPWALLGLVPLLDGLAGHHRARRQVASAGRAVAAAPIADGARGVMGGLMREHFDAPRPSPFTGADGGSGAPTASRANVAGEPGPAVGAPGSVLDAGIRGASSLRNAPTTSRANVGESAPEDAHGPPAMGSPTPSTSTSPPAVAAAAAAAAGSGAAPPSSPSLPVAQPPDLTQASAVPPAPPAASAPAGVQPGAQSTPPGRGREHMPVPAPAPASDEGGVDEPALSGAMFEQLQLAAEDSSMPRARAAGAAPMRGPDQTAGVTPPADLEVAREETP